MNATVQNELEYVKKVLLSCKTEKQKENALRWAKEWAHRQKHHFLHNPVAWTELYFSIID